MEFAEAFYNNGRRWFWRIEYPVVVAPINFQFDGVIKSVEVDVAYPCFGEINYPYMRSIEDANLIPNTYSNYYIFHSEAEAKAGIDFLAYP